MRLDEAKEILNKNGFILEDTESLNREEIEDKIIKTIKTIGFSYEDSTSEEIIYSKEYEDDYSVEVVIFDKKPKFMLNIRQGNMDAELKIPGVRKFVSWNDGNSYKLDNYEKYIEDIIRVDKYLSDIGE